jgi:hypothetical protein
MINDQLGDAFVFVFILKELFFFSSPLQGEMSRTRDGRVSHQFAKPKPPPLPLLGKGGVERIFRIPV